MTINTFTFLIEQITLTFYKTTWSYIILCVHIELSKLLNINYAHIEKDWHVILCRYTCSMHGAFLINTSQLLAWHFFPIMEVDHRLDYKETETSG